VEGVFFATHGQVVAVDGKTLRQSHDKSSGKANIHLVSAWASQTGIVLGQHKVEDKSNEITAIGVFCITPRKGIFQRIEVCLAG